MLLTEKLYGLATVEMSYLVHQPLKCQTQTRLNEIIRSLQSTGNLQTSTDVTEETESALALVLSLPKTSHYSLCSCLK